MHLYPRRRYISRRRGYSTFSLCSFAWRKIWNSPNSDCPQNPAPVLRRPALSSDWSSAIKRMNETNHENLAKEKSEICLEHSAHFACRGRTWSSNRGLGDQSPSSLGVDGRCMLGKNQLQGKTKLPIKLWFKIKTQTTTVCIILFLDILDYAGG